MPSPDCRIPATPLLCTKGHSPVPTGMSPTQSISYMVIPPQCCVLSPSVMSDSLQPHGL